MLTEGLPFALPVPSTVGEGAAAAAHKFQTQFLAHLERCLACAKKQAESDKAAAEAQIEEASAELGTRRAAVDKASSELDDAIAQVEAKKAHIQELEAAVSKAESDYTKWEAKGSKQQNDWEKLRQLYEGAKSVDEGALRMLEADEGDEDVRAAAASAVSAFIAEHNVEQVLLSAAPMALAVKPSARGTFDRMTTEAVVNVVKKRVAELGDKLESIAPEEKNIRAEVVGLWAIFDCARDDLLTANEELATATMVRRDERKFARDDALGRVQEQEVALQSHEAARASAVANEHQLADACAALERLAQPEDKNLDEEAGQPDLKRQRVEEATL